MGAQGASQPKSAVSWPGQKPLKLDPRGRVSFGDGRVDDEEYASKFFNAENTCACLPRCVWTYRDHF
jgi:hypothetical protein